MSGSSTLRPATDNSPADWVVSALGPFGAVVSSLVPASFESFARVFHPASASHGSPVRWSTIAAWAGRVMHPTAQFESISRPRAGQGRGERPFTQSPSVGQLDQQILGDLCRALVNHTTTPELCWCCYWIGFGWWRPRALDSLHARGRPAPASVAPRVIREAPTVHLPSRDYLLFEGALRQVPEFMAMAPAWTGHVSPNLFWPQDHAWCVATEIDHDSTIVGGAAALIADLLDDPALEVEAITVTDEFWISSDVVNR